MSDIDVVREIYHNMAERNVDRLFELIDAGFVVTQDPALPWGGRHVGHDGFLAFALALTSAIDSAVTTEALFEVDGDVVQFGRTRGTTVATGKAFDIPEVHRWTIRDGKALRAHFSIDTAAMLDALD